MCKKSERNSVAFSQALTGDPDDLMPVNLRGFFRMTLVLVPLNWNVQSVECRRFIVHEVSAQLIGKRAC